MSSTVILRHVTLAYVRVILRHRGCIAAFVLSLSLDFGFDTRSYS